MTKDLKNKVDKYIQSIYKQFRLKLYDYKFSARVAYISGIVTRELGVFGVKNVNEVIEYIFKEYVPQPLHNNFS